MTIAWATVENAVAAWVRSGSGLDATHVIWSRQNSNRPASTFISLSVLSVRPVGRDWLETRDAADPEDGAEIEHVARGHREAVLRMQCFAGTATGATSPQAVLEGVIAAARLPSNRAALNAAGVGVASFGTVLPIDGVIGSSLFEPRAVLEARAFLSSEVVETSTYIESVEVTDDTLEETYTVERS